MPLYEYKCQHCGHVVEVLQKIDEDAPPCAECSSEPQNMAKLVSTPNFHLRGGGWASDGYAGSPAGDGYRGCKNKGQRTQRAAELGDDMPD